MKTTLEIDEKLLSEAMRLTGRDTMKSTVELALTELVAEKRREALAQRIMDGDLSLTLEDLGKMREE
jgi:Arc/MetJ family transcription regulator